MIDATEQEREDCFQRIDDIQHALDNPVENDDDNTTYERKQKHPCYLKTREWDMIQDINTKISHLENTDHQTDPEIHHNTPPKPPKHTYDYKKIGIRMMTPIVLTTIGQRYTTQSHAHKTRISRH